jgi:SAM-dependent methyltransferase
VTQDTTDKLTATLGLALAAGSHQLCPFCHTPLDTAYRRLPGYQRGLWYEIRACGSCEVQLADTSQEHADIYNCIYSHAPVLPGYSRYHGYAQEVLRSKDPLGYLAPREYMYGFVSSYLRQLENPSAISILEVGAGLGYLTYALGKCGYRVTGIDLSTDAVQSARGRFGDYFKCCSCEELASSGSRFDVIIVTEVIEHVTDPVSFLKAVRSCLTSNGVVLLTTPNRSYFPRDYVWHTELPPVHLWWFSEEAIRLCAHAAGFAAHMWHAPMESSSSHTTQRYRLVRTCHAVLDERGNPVLPLEDKQSYPSPARRLARWALSGSRVAWARCQRCFRSASRALKYPDYLCTDTDRLRCKTLAVVLTPHLACTQPANAGTHRAS